MQRQLITLTNAISHGFGFVGNLIAQHGLPTNLALTNTHSSTVSHSPSTPTSVHDLTKTYSALSPSTEQLNPPSAHRQSQGLPPILSGTSTPQSPSLASMPPTHVTTHTANENCIEDCRTVTLTDGTLVHFRPSDLRPPPTISFADDVPKLLREWYRSDYIVLDGHGVPISDWDKLYKKRIAIQALVKAWDTFRSTWGNWKVRCSVFI